MPYEVCYRALLSISVVEGLKPHTSHDLLRVRLASAARRGAPRLWAIYNPLPRPALAGLDHNVLLSIFRFHPQDSLAGGPPARWFVILLLYAKYTALHAHAKRYSHISRSRGSAHGPTPSSARRAQSSSRDSSAQSPPTPSVSQSKPSCIFTLCKTL